MENILPQKMQPVAVRRTLQWLLAPIVIVTIAFGWKYPLLGFAVPVAMITGLVGGMLRGRWVCGNLCPRGSLFDRVIAPIAPRRPIPPLLRHMGLRWIIFALLMGFMAWRLAADPGSLRHWGLVFWSICTLTTAVGLATAMLIHPRTWCAFCPVGTLQNAIGGGRQPLQIDAACRECGKCEKNCPMDLSIVRHKPAGALGDRDCLRCPECISACPVNALAWPEAKG